MKLISASPRPGPPDPQPRPWLSAIRAQVLAWQTRGHPHRLRLGVTDARSTFRGLSRRPCHAIATESNLG